MLNIGFSPLKWFFIVGVVLGDKLPFQCPYKVPKGSPDPTTTGVEGGGLLPTLYENGGLSKNTSDVYAEYRAALALVPCDARAISVFTRPLRQSSYKASENLTYTISVIYVYDKPVEDLKKWLTEKLYDTVSYENPIKDLIKEQCPELAKEPTNPYIKRLSGEEILNILCDESCERIEEEKQFPECPKTSVDVCEIADCSKPNAAELCPGVCYQAPSPSFVPSLPYPAHHRNYPSQPNAASKRAVHHASFNNQYSQYSYHTPQNAATYQPHYQPYGYQSYHPVAYLKKATFDDAPQLVYGISFRVRRTYNCGEKGLDCDMLEEENKVVECDISRFSQCASDWLDCVPEDEKYLQMTTFYDECNLVDSGNPLEKDVLTNASVNQCTGARRCENGRFSDGDEPYVGYDPSGNCTCPITQTPALYHQATRLKRKTGEYFTTAGGKQCRVLRSKMGGRKVRCGANINVRSRGYDPATKIAVNIDETFGIIEDPALCVVAGNNCV